MWAALLSAAIGIWLMAAPAVLGYPGAASVHDRIVGPLIASFGIIAVAEVTRSVRRVNSLLGAWLVLAPWILGFPTAALVNSVVSGIAVGSLSLVRGSVDERYAGGWSSLWRAERPGDRAAAPSPPGGV